MNKNRLALFALLLAPAAALAQAVFPPPAPAQISGLYVGASFGVAYNRSGCVGSIGGGGRSCDSKDPSFSVFAGYQANSNFAGEVSFRDLGKTISSGFGSIVSFHTQAVDASLLGRLEIMDRLFAHARVGVYGARQEDPAGNLAAQTSYGLTYGLGAQWELLRNWAVRGDWQRYRNVGRTLDYGSSTYDVLSVGALFRFR
ncbi:MAG: outer membrane beta-barrel protein [Burkholderiales bacterium]